MAVERAERLLLSAGAAGPIIFVGGYLANGARQPEYSSWHDTISTLSLGRHGWLQDANFMLFGASTLCFAEGLRRSGAVKATGFGLEVIAGLGLVVIGLFRSDPILGFPPGKPTVVTPRGTVHNVASLVVFVSFPAAALATTSPPLRGWDVFSITCSVLCVAALAAFFATVEAAAGEDGGNSPAGFLERLPTVFIGVWQVAFVLRVLTGRAVPAYGDRPISGMGRRLRRAAGRAFRPVGG